MSALTDLVEVVPPRWAHRIARLLRLEAALSMFCEHCPDVPLWADADELAAS